MTLTSKIGHALVVITTIYLCTVVIGWPEYLGVFGRIGALCAAFMLGVFVQAAVERRHERLKEENVQPRDPPGWLMRFATLGGERLTRTYRLVICGAVVVLTTFVLGYFNAPLWSVFVLEFLLIPVVLIWLLLGTEDLS